MNFEQQKQEIIEHLEIISNVCCDISEIIDLVQQLTPPKPPTCASCKKLTNCKISNAVFPMYNAIDFGCNKHSDYERKE